MEVFIQYKGDNDSAINPAAHGRVFVGKTIKAIVETGDIIKVKVNGEYRIREVTGFKIYPGDDVPLTIYTKAATENLITID